MQSEFEKISTKLYSNIDNYKLLTANATRVTKKSNSDYKVLHYSDDTTVIIFSDKFTNYTTFSAKKAISLMKDALSNCKILITDFIDPKYHDQVEKYVTEFGNETIVTRKDTFVHNDPINNLNHKCTIATDKELNELKNFYMEQNIKTVLPNIKQNDVISIWLDAKIKDVIKIHSFSQVSNSESVIYKVVKP